MPSVFFVHFPQKKNALKRLKLLNELLYDYKLTNWLRWEAATVLDWWSDDRRLCCPSFPFHRTDISGASDLWQPYAGPWRCGDGKGSPCCPCSCGAQCLNGMYWDGSVAESLFLVLWKATSFIVMILESPIQDSVHTKQVALNLSDIAVSVCEFDCNMAFHF